MADYLLNMIWTVSAGLLSLIALLGIFVSLSGQQKIEKRRELYWELLLPESRTFDRSGLSDEQIIANAQYLQNRYRFYSHLEAGDASKEKGLLSKAVDAGVFLMQVVVVFWGIGISIVAFSVYNKASLAGQPLCKLLFEFFGGVGTVFFALLILAAAAMDKIRFVTDKLRTPWENEKLPAIKELLNVNNEGGSIDTFNYLLNTLFVQLRLHKWEGKEFLVLQIVYPLPFYGFSVTPEIEVKWSDDGGKMFHAEPAAVKYDEKLSPSETAAPLIFKFELGAGTKDEIASLKVGADFQSNKQKKTATGKEEISIAELQTWKNVSVRILPWMTDEESENWHNHRGIPVIGEKIER